MGVYELTSAQTRSPLQLNVLLVVSSPASSPSPLWSFWGDSMSGQCPLALSLKQNKVDLNREVSKGFNDDKIIGQQFSHHQRITVNSSFLAPVALQPGRFSLSEVTSVTAVLLYSKFCASVSLLGIGPKGGTCLHRKAVRWKTVVSLFIFKKNCQSTVIKAHQLTRAITNAAL